MIGENEVQQLADLSRIALSEAEKTKLQRDLGSILNYISELSSAPALAPEKQDLGLVKNVMRADGNPRPSRQFTEAILAEAPRVKRGLLEVKKILNPNNG